MGARRPAHADHPPPSLLARRLTDRDPPPRDGPGWGLGAPVAGYFVATFAAALGTAVAVAVAGEGPSLATLAGGLAGLWAGQLGAAVVASRRLGTGRPARDLGLSFRRSDLVTGTLTALVLSFVAIPLLYAALDAVGVLDGESLDRLDDRARELVDTAGQGVGFVVLFLLVAVGTPVVEEVFFRGLLQPPVVARLGGAGGVVVTGVVFAAVHLEPLELPGLFVVGLALGALRQRVGRLGPAIVAHAVFNAQTLVALAVTP